jgi:hypothetical protein
MLWSTSISWAETIGSQKIKETSMKTTVLIWISREEAMKVLQKKNIQLARFTS